MRYMGKSGQGDVCNSEYGPEDGPLIFCDWCNKGYHLECHEPPLPEPPEGDWICFDCKLERNSICAVCGMQDDINGTLVLCEAADWRQIMHPKFHWLVHLPQYLQRWGVLLSCFVHERRHRILKRYADNTQNTRTYERTLLSEATSHHLASLKA